jgi:hypothetical protein
MLTSFRAVFIISLMCFAVASGCGNGGDPDPPSCSPLPALRISPQTATIDHNASPPGNSQRFFAFAVSSPGCAVPLVNFTNVSWSVSDNTDVSISNTQGSTFGTATCVNATPSPVTVTATLPASANSGKAASGTASLTCQ